MLLETNKDKGRAGLSLAIAYYGTQGYTISLPLNDTQWYDLIMKRMKYSRQYNVNLQQVQIIQSVYALLGELKVLFMINY